MTATSYLPATGTAWERPANFTEAAELLTKADGAARIVAGCTALSPFALRMSPGIRLAVDLMGVADAMRIESDGARLRIGATATIGGLAHDATIAAQAPLLADAARGIGDEVVRGMATVGGNVAARVPAPFELPAVLAALGAEALVVTPDGARTMPVEDAGHPDHGLGPFDLLASIELDPDPKARWAYRKLTTNVRAYVIANLAIYAPRSGPARAYASLGGPIPQRLGAVEAALSVDERFDPASVARQACERLSARADVLASGAYRVRALGAAIETELTRMLATRSEDA